MFLQLRRRQPAIARIALLALLSATLAAGMLVMLFRSPDTAPERATVLPSPIPLQAFTLVDQNGESFTRDSFAGQWNLVFFGFTNCPDICPLTLQQLTFARRRMAEENADARLPGIVFVSVDPQRDDTEAVGAYAAAFGDGVIGVTGDLEEIDKLTSALGIYHSRPPTGDGAYAVEHSAAVVVIDEQSNYYAVFSAPHDAETLARDMTLIMGAG